MKPRYCLVHLTNRFCPPPELVLQAAGAGYDCVSFRGIPARTKQSGGFSSSLSGPPPFDFAGDRQMLRQTKEALAETGLAVNDIENARIFPGVDVRDYEADLEAAAELGCKNILTNIWSEEESFSMEQFQRLCELAAGYDQSVHLEFVTWSAVKDLRTAARMLLASGWKNVGIVVDTLHFYRSRVKAEELDFLPVEWFSYVHLCDCGPEIPEDIPSLVKTGIQERLIPGEGAVDIRGLLERIPQAVRGLEIPNPDRMKHQGIEPYIRYCLEQTRAYLEG